MEDMVLEENGRSDLVSRSLAFPKAVIALLGQQRRRLQAALDRDLTVGAMLLLLIEECLVPWVDQKAMSASRTSRTPSRGNGRSRRR